MTSWLDGRVFDIMKSPAWSTLRELGIAVTILLVVPFGAAAQTLRDDLKNLFLVDFVRQQYPGTPDTSVTVGKVLGAQISTFPLSSSSSGFTWKFDPSLGVLARSTRTFGPTIAERPVTIGAGKVAVGFTHQYLKYDSLGGRDLSGSNITVYKADLNRAPYFNYTLDLELSSMTDLFYVNFGATDKLDVAIAVPFVTVSLDGTTTQSGPNTSGAQSVHTSRAARGVGDIALRAKYQFGRFQGNDYGVAMDVRVASGDADDFLGSGKSSIKISGLLSRTMDRVSPYANLAMTAGGISKEVGYIAGVDIFVTPKLSIATDVFGRRLLDVADYTEITAPYAPNPAFTITLPTETANGLNLALWTIGAKVNVARTLLLTATAITSLTKSGLRARFTPLVGLEYSF
jgi:hypothetical protein